MRRIPALFLMLVLSLLSLARPSGAATWTLRPDGTGDFPTIQAAIDAAADGDELLLEDGTYTRDGDDFLDFLGKAITIRSLSGNPASCVIDGEGQRHVGAEFDDDEGLSAVLADLTFTRSETSNPVLQIVEASPTIRNVVIREFPETAIDIEHGSPVLSDLELCEGGSPTVSCWGGAPVFSGCLLEANTLASSRGGLEFRRADVTFEDCTIRNYQWDQSWESVSLSVVEGSVTVRRCEIRDNPVPGISIDGSWLGATVLVEDSVFLNNETGIQATGRDFGPVAHLTIRGCLFAGNHRGVSVGSPVQALVEDSVLEGNYTGLSAISFVGATGFSLLVRDSEVRGNRQAGIGSSYPEVTIERCRVQGNGTEGGNAIGLSHASPGTIRDCLITGTAGVGLSLKFATCTVERCTIASNASDEAGAAIRVDRNSAVEIRESIVWGNCGPGGSEIYVETSASLEIDCAAVDLSRVTGDGLVSVTGDVLQQDPPLCAPARCSEVPTIAGVYAFAFHSPAHRFECGHLGALPPGCGINTGVGSAVESLSWGQIKSRHRSQGEGGTP